MDYQFQKLTEQFKSIPEDVRLAISSVRVADALQQIGEKHNLHIDKVGMLFDETGAVMLGLTHPSDYIKNLTKNLGVDGDMAKSIAFDVNEQIFRPIRESLKKIHRIDDEPQPVPPIQPTTPTTQPTVQKKEEREHLEPAPTNKTEKKKEDVLDKEQILREIEKPELAVTSKEGGEDIIEEKLKGTFKMPRKESEYTEISSEDDKKGRDAYKEQDPYREPIE